MHTYIVCETRDGGIALLVDNESYVFLGLITRGEHTYHLACANGDFIYICSRSTSDNFSEIYKFNLKDYSLAKYCKTEEFDNYGYPDHMYVTSTGEIGILYTTNEEHGLIVSKYSSITLEFLVSEVIYNEYGKPVHVNPKDVKEFRLMDGTFYFIDNEDTVHMYDQNRQILLKLRTTVKVREDLLCSTYIRGKYVNVIKYGHSYSVTTEDPYLDNEGAGVWHSTEIADMDPYIWPTCYAELIFMVDIGDGNVLISNLVTKTITILNIYTFSSKKLDLSAFIIINTTMISAS